MSAMPTIVATATMVLVASLVSWMRGSSCGSTTAPATTPTARPSHDDARARNPSR